MANEERKTGEVLLEMRDVVIDGYSDERWHEIIKGVDLTLRRVSDRNLLRAIQDDYFGRPLSEYEIEEFSTELAEEVWTGVGEVQNSLNANMTTRLPLGEVLADQAPGIYTLTARIDGIPLYDDPGATQWFVPICA